MAITFWGRKGDRATLDALAFLREHHYGADKLRDLDADPPSEAEWSELVKGEGVRRFAADPGAVVTDDAGLLAWLRADARRIRSPILLTPRGALCGFRERAWRDFLDIGKGR